MFFSFLIFSYKFCAQTSESLIGKILVYNVFDDAPNYSDHLPIVCSFQLEAFKLKVSLIVRILMAVGL